MPKSNYYGLTATKTKDTVGSKYDPFGTSDYLDSSIIKSKIGSTTTKTNKCRECSMPLLSSILTICRDCEMKKALETKKIK